MINRPETVICLENVSVRYRLPGERIYTFKEYAIRFLQRRIRFKEFYALEDVSSRYKKRRALWDYRSKWCGKKHLAESYFPGINPQGWTDMDQR